MNQPNPQSLRAAGGGPGGPETPPVDPAAVVVAVALAATSHAALYRAMREAFTMPGWAVRDVTPLIPPDALEPLRPLLRGRRVTLPWLLGHLARQLDDPGHAEGPRLNRDPSSTPPK